MQIQELVRPFFPGGILTNEMIAQVPYLKDSNHHDFGHTINKFRFGADLSADQEADMLPKEMVTRAKLAIRDPLQSFGARTDECMSQQSRRIRCC